MPSYIPRWAVYLAIGVAVIVAIYLVSEHIDAATSLLPGGGER